jgi:ABC-type lipoprotein export system ATPase subunit
MGKPEFFEIRKFARRYDRKTGKFIIDIVYKTKTDITDRTVKVAEAFGLGVDGFQEHVIYDNVKLKIAPNDIVYITGDSGSGKSVLLRALEKNLRPETININDIQVEQAKPLIDTVGKTFDEGLSLLSRVGLNDAFLFIRRYNQLSDGQKYRFKLAKIIEADRQYWFADEFCSTLDRDTAKIVAFNVQKIAREEGKAVFAATTHTDLFQDLKPSVHIHKRFGREIKVRYFPNEIDRECSLVKDMHVEEGTKKDYEKLAVFHYRDSRLFAYQKFFVLKRGEEIVGVIVYGSPPIVVSGRRKAFGRNLSIQEINRDLTRISRVVLHPKYRTIGLGVKLVAETLPLAGKPYVETIAVMAKYNPFFEKAGMTKILESKPHPGILKAVEKLRAFGFNPIFLTSERMNLKKLQSMSTEELNGVKTVFKEISGSIYGKRIMGVRQAFLKKKEFQALVDAADVEKLAKMLRILGFLKQTKVYLFWKGPQSGKKA